MGPWGERKREEIRKGRKEEVKKAERGGGEGGWVCLVGFWGWGGGIGVERGKRKGASVWSEFADKTGA